VRVAISTAQNENSEEVISEFRTSTFLYLTKAQDRVVRTIESRAAGLVGLPQINVEPLQVVRYSKGQKFDTHHDAGTILDDGNIEVVPPVRLATFFVVRHTPVHPIGVRRSQQYLLR
jgi:hypothetical protein